MNLVCIAEHTIDVDLLTPGGWVLDAGCRNFHFAHHLAERGCRVLAIDADPTVTVPETIEIGVDKVVTKLNKPTFLNRAIAAENGMRSLVMHKDPQARYLAPSGFSSVGGEKVEAVTVLRWLEHVQWLDEVAERAKTLQWDVIKLDVEGSEYDILQAWPGPIAKQISIEFHEHVCPRPPEVYEAVFKHLGQWYDVKQHVKDARFCCAPNWWDSLIILREEFRASI